MSENKITYLELPSNDVSALKTFYGQLFGWTFQDYGDDYAAVEGGGLEGGFNGDPASKSKAPMVMVETTDIRTMLKRVQDAGGTIKMQIFAYPRGPAFPLPRPERKRIGCIPTWCVTP